MIICENCTNFEDMEEAKEMIRIAKECGASLSKFQLFDAEDDKGKPHYDWVKEHELTFDQAKMLFNYGASIGIEVFFSVFGVKFVDWCERIKVKRYKLACGLRDYATWKAIQFTDKPIIISYPAFPNENYFYGVASHIYCPAGYPQKDLRLILVDEFDGFSDHTIGLDAAKIAIARGAEIIEKHFVLEHNPLFPDDAWSMDVSQLRELVAWENTVRQILG